MKKLDLSSRSLGSLFVILLFVPILITAYTNCVKGFNLDSNLSSVETSPIDSDDQKPATLIPEKINSLDPSQFISSKSITREGQLIAQEDANCMTNSNWDSCIFWKNPLGKSPAAYTGKLVRGTNLSTVQTFGVKLERRTNNSYLASSSIDIFYSALAPLNFKKEVDHYFLTLENGTLRKPYADDVSDTNTSTTASNAYSVAQIQNYFWLTHAELSIKERTKATNPDATEYYNLTGARNGIYWASDKFIYVNAFITGGLEKGTCSGTILCNNAFFVPADVAGDNNVKWQGSIFLGYVADSEANTIKHEVGLAAEVAIHEVGHANLWHARNKKSYIDGIEISGNTYCSFAKGCLSAIDEGQADFFSIMIFPDSPSIGETFSSSQTPFRNVIALEGKRLSGPGTTDFEEYKPPVISSGQNLGEIHDLGEFYVSILWEIYKDPRIDKRAFEATFVYHLRLLGDSAGYADSWVALISVDKTYFRSRNSSIIDEVFARKGVSK